MSQNKNLEIKQLQKIYQYIYEAKLENLNSVVQTIIKYFDKNFPYSFNSLLCKFVYSSFISHGKGINKYIQFLKLLETIEEQIFTQNPQIFQILYEIIVNYCTNDSHYIIAHLLEENLISAELVKKHKHYDDTNNPYFMHLISLNDDIENYVHLRNIKFPFPIEELSNNDFALHKKLVHEGHNPNEILKIIRNDEVEKLQEITSQNDFDFNQYIEPSIYERYDFINGYNVTLIDYAAFFGSVKCFKYLLMNGSNVNETSKYAVVGGNTEIILLCKQNHSSFEGAYEAAIKFHRNDIFKYLYENKIVENINLEYLGIKCILYHNYDIFLYLQDEGLEINDEIISEATTDGNLFFIMCFLHNIKDINKIFFKSVRSNNFELVQFLLKQGGIDINRRDIDLHY